MFGSPYTWTYPGVALTSTVTAVALLLVLIMMLTQPSLTMSEVVLLKVLRILYQTWQTLQFASALGLALDGLRLPVDACCNV